MSWSKKKDRFYYPFYNTHGHKEYENNLNKLRIDYGLTLPELAQKIGINKSHVWRIAEGYEGPFYARTKETEKPQVKKWGKKLCELFNNCDILEIFPREGCFIGGHKELTEYQIHFSLTNIDNYRQDAYDKLNTKILKQSIMRVIRTLTPREAFVIRKIYGIGCMPLQKHAIGALLVVSIQRVSQIEMKAIRKLKHPVRTKILQQMSSE
jgi:RNA polymerase primary sigma factor